MTEETPKRPPIRFDVRIPEDTRIKLKKWADKEHRSSNLQAIHFIENGLKGMDSEAMNRRMENIESMLAEVLKRLDEK